MKKMILLLITSVFCVNKSFAQNPLVKQWDYRYGGIDYDILTSLNQTTDKGFILGGWSISGMSGDKTQPGWGLYDYWIVKTDSLGLMQWNKDFGGSGNDLLQSMKQTADGGYILGGISASGISGDKTEPNWDVSGNTSDYWVVKLNSSGSKQWDKRFGGINDEQLFAIQQTSDGGYILGGYSESGISGNKTQVLNGNEDFWIVKIDAAGNYQWDKDFGGNLYANLFGLEQTADKGYILGGYSNSNFTGNYDYWIVKTDSLGGMQWNNTYGGADDDLLSAVRQTPDGGYIIGGSSESGISGNKTAPSFGGFDHWIVKTDSTGIIQWDKSFGGTDDEDEIGTISFTSGGGYLFSGSSYSQIGGNKTENNLGFEQSWIFKTDASGNKIWDKTILTPGHDEKGKSVITDDGCFVTANITNGAAGGYKSLPSWGLDDYWLVKFCDSVTTSSVTPLVINKTTLSVYPDPASDFIQLSFENNENNFDVEILNTMGKTILKVRNQKQINISNLQDGIYFTRIKTQDFIYSQKFIKN